MTISQRWAVGELLKARYNRGLESNLYFWRDRSGNEIDVVIEEGNKLVPVEIKAGQTVSRDYFRNLDRWRKLAGRVAETSWLVYGGDKGIVSDTSARVPQTAAPYRAAQGHHCEFTSDGGSPGRRFLWLLSFRTSKGK